MSEDPVEMADDFAVASDNRDLTEREQQIRERLAAATPGPWRTWREGDPETWFLAGSANGTEYELGTIGGYYQESASPETGLAAPADNSPDAELIANAPSDLAYLLDALAAARAELEAIERTVASDRADLLPEKRGMPISELVQVALKRREDAVAEGWAYSDVVERDGHRDRRDWEAENGRLREALKQINSGILPDGDHVSVAVAEFADMALLPDGEAPALGREATDDGLYVALNDLWESLHEGEDGELFEDFTEERWDQFGAAYAQAGYVLAGGKRRADRPLAEEATS